MVILQDYRHVVSLNNVTATGAGASVGGTDTQKTGQYSQGVTSDITPRYGIYQANIHVKVGPVAMIAVQALMPDGTWVTVANFNTNASGNDSYMQLWGPFLDMRLNVTAYTSGTVYGFIAVI